MLGFENIKPKWGAKAGSSGIAREEDGGDLTAKAAFPPYLPSERASEATSG